MIRPFLENVVFRFGEFSLRILSLPHQFPVFLVILGFAKYGIFLVKRNIHSDGFEIESTHKFQNLRK